MHWLFAIKYFHLALRIPVFSPYDNDEETEKSRAWADKVVKILNICFFGTLVPFLALDLYFKDSWLRLNALSRLVTLLILIISV